MIGRFLTDEEIKTRQLTRVATRNAIRTGVLKSPRDCICVDCGEPAGEYDHHLGYGPEHALTVEAVCRGCHNKRTAARHEGYPKGLPHQYQNVRFTGSSAADVIAAYTAWRSALEGAG